MSDWANKLVGGVGRIAVLLHLAALGASPVSGDSGYYGKNIQDCATTDWLETVSDQTARSSITIGRYLLDHAQSAFALIGADPDLSHAQRILA